MTRQWPNDKIAAATRMPIHGPYVDDTPAAIAIPAATRPTPMAGAIQVRSGPKSCFIFAGISARYQAPFRTRSAPSRQPG